MSTMEWEKEGREGDVRKHKGRKHGKKEKEREKEAWARETPLPQGVSAKAAERLGIVGAAVPQVKRPPTLVESPEESDEEEAFSEEEEPSEDEPPLPTPPVLSADERARGASTWVPPSEWDAPPIVARVESASLPPSTSSRTITPSASARTVTPSTSSKTVKQLGLASMDLSPAPQRAFSPQTHTRGSSTASTASATSALSTASSAASSTSSGAWSASPPEPPRFAHGLAQHPGLILWPGTFIPVPPAELEMHATKHMQTLLASKPALAEFVARCVDPATGARLVSDEEFEDAVWDYECFRRPRFNWPDLPEGEEVSDMPTPVSARSTHHLMQPPRTPTVPGDREEVGPFGRHELVHVRTLRVFGAVKGGAPEIL
ncbi:hypothetical protein C8R44DRAFT_757016 [Mycena epipterygia]|nr:hypothetical protein C8R44DRAFT_757016 [Mycena epipterygia]